MDKASRLRQQVDNQQTCHESNMMQFKTHWIKWDLLRINLNRIDTVTHLKKSRLILGNCHRLPKILTTWLFLQPQAKDQPNCHKVPLILQEELRAKEERDHVTATKSKETSTLITNTLPKQRVGKDYPLQRTSLTLKLKFFNW
jgi:hypothetical protein